MNPEEIYATYFPMVYRYVFYKIRHKENAKDIASQVFLKVFRHLDKHNAEKFTGANN